MNANSDTDRESFRAERVDALYSDPRSFIIGGVGACAAMLLIACRNSSLFLTFLATALILLTAFRFGLTQAYRRARKSLSTNLSKWEWAYQIAATLYIFLIGLFTYTSFAISSAALDRVLAIATLIGYMAGIPGRNFASSAGVIAQILCGGLPLLASMLVGGSVEWMILIPILSSFLFGLESLARRLRKIFEQATFRAFEVKLVADRFRAALDAMPYGLAMLDDQARLVVYNDRLLELVSAKPSTLHEISLDSFISVVGCETAADLFADVNKSMRSTQNSLRAEPLVLSKSDDRVALTYHRKPGGGGLVLVEDISDRRRAEKRIEELALTDSMTGLSNRVHMRDKISTILEANPVRNYAIFFVDIDKFKLINDSLGHAEGDIVIRSVAERLKRLDLDCIIGRFGGDEFVLFTSCSNSTHAEQIANRIIDALSTPYALTKQQIVVGASVGVALFPSHDMTFDELVRKADAALYRAKDDGRGVARIYSPIIDNGNRIRNEVALDLHRALQEEEFEVHYQPIYDKSSQGFTSCEALVRWRHPKRGLLFPGEFISVAEESNLILELTQAVLTQACRDCLTWPSSMSVAVNISPVCFRRGDLVAAVTKALRSSDLPPRRLEIELTESILLDDPALAAATMRMLHVSGVKISIDDFGTGYSNLSYLHRLPLHRMKIDKSFLSSIFEDEKASFMLRGLARLGSELGLKVLVEGVEDGKQFDLLYATHSIDEMQGFYFARPMSNPDLVKFLQTHLVAAESRQRA